MHAETPFRLALVAIVVISISIAGYHRWQASRSGERISRKEEGLWIGVPLRLAGLGMLVGTLGYLIHPDGMPWAQFAVPEPVRWCGAGTGLLCAAMLYWTLANLGKNLTDTVAIRQNAYLVTSGPYRWVRHPFYVSTALLILSVTLLSANWFVGLNGLLVLSLLAIRTPKEEQKLVEKFGDDYRNYMAHAADFSPNGVEPSDDLATRREPPGGEESDG